MQKIYILYFDSRYPHLKKRKRQDKASVVVAVVVVVGLVVEEEDEGTVDGRNPAPVELGSLSHYLQVFIHRRWLYSLLKMGMFHCHVSLLEGSWWLV